MSEFNCARSFKDGWWWFGKFDMAWEIMQVLMACQECRFYSGKLKRVGFSHFWPLNQIQRSRKLPFTNFFYLKNPTGSRSKRRAESDVTSPSQTFFPPFRAGGWWRHHFLHCILTEVWPPGTPRMAPLLDSFHQDQSCEVVASQCQARIIIYYCYI